MTLKFKGKQLTFKDTYALISTSLASFPKMFGLSNIQKEIYPYNHFNKVNINNIGTILEADLYETKQWTEEQFEIFNENIDKIENCRIDEFHFDMKAYCVFYCNQDVRILKQGHSKFRYMCLEYLNINVDKVISAASLANTYFKHNVYSKIDNLKNMEEKLENLFKELFMEED
ncbi:DNA polymerase, putative, partial [Entamoeba invadens IP1]